jgi:copper(I)-binding protein
MRKVENLRVKANEIFDMEEQGFHFMLFDLDKTIKAGDAIAGKLNFKIAGEVDVEFIVIKLSIDSHKMH